MRYILVNERRPKGLPRYCAYNFFHPITDHYCRELERESSTARQNACSPTQWKQIWRWEGLMRKFWRFLLQCIEALAEDDYNLDQKRRDWEDKQKRHLSYLGSGKR